MNNRLANRLSTLEADQNRSGGNEALRERMERAKARMPVFSTPAEQADWETRSAAMTARIRRVSDECRRMGRRPSIAMLLHAARMEA